MRDACSTINIGNLSHTPTDFSGANTCDLLWNTLPLPENCWAQHCCGSLCNAGTLNDNDSGYTLRENTFQGSYVGQLRVGSQSMYNHLANIQNFHYQCQFQHQRYLSFRHHKKLNALISSTPTPPLSFRGCGNERSGQSQNHCCCYRN